MKRGVVPVLGLLAILILSTANATPPPEDGTYTGTASGEYSTGSCSPPGMDTGPPVSFTADVTVIVENNAEKVTISFSSPDLTASGNGPSNGSTLTLSFSPPGANVNITAQNSGDVVSIVMPATPSVSQSNGEVTIGSSGVTGSTENCSFFSLDWFAFDVTLVATGKVITGESASTEATTEDTTRIFANADYEPIHQRSISRLPNAHHGSESGFAMTDSGITYNLDSGLNAGDWPMSLGGWVNYSYIDFEDEFFATAFDGDRHGFMAGLDYQPTDNSVLGVALGYETADIDTTFNQGEQETDGFTVAPYFAVLLTDTWSIDMSLGYTNLDTDQFRTDPTTGARVTSEVDGDRWFGAFTLNGLWYYDRWILGARAGALYARTSLDDFVESDGTAVTERKATIGEFTVGGDVAYSLDEWEPYVSVLYENDFSQTETPVAGPVQPDFDDDDFLIGVGVRYFNTNGWSGNVEYNKRVGREDFDEDSIHLTIQGQF